MMISSSSLEVHDSSLPPGTPLVYEIVGSGLRGPLRGVVSIGEPANYEVPPGVYEVRLIHPRLGRLTKVLQVGEEVEQVYFSEMRRESRSAEAAKHSQKWSLSWFRSDASHLHLEGRETLSIDPDQGAGPLPSRLQEHEHGIAVLDRAEGSLAVRLPPGAAFLEVQRTNAGEVALRPRTKNLKAESMLDYAMEGYPAHASVVRGQAQAFELVHQEYTSPAGALIGAYYLLKTGEARDCVPLLEELWQNFPQLPDAGVAFGNALMQAGESPGRIRDTLLRACALGVPFYREGLRRLRAGLDYCFELSEGKDEAVIQAIERIRPYQMDLRYDNAVTSWVCVQQDPRPLTPERVRKRVAVRAAFG